MYGPLKNLVTAMGLCIVPANFHLLINRLFSNFIDDFVVVHVDDTLVYSDTHERNSWNRLVPLCHAPVGTDGTYFLEVFFRDYGHLVSRLTC